MRQNTFQGRYATPLGEAFGNLTSQIFKPKGNAWDRDTALARAGYLDSQADLNYANIERDNRKLNIGEDASKMFGKAITDAYAPREQEPPDEQSVGQVLYRPPSQQQVIQSIGDVMGQYARLDPKGIGSNINNIFGTIGMNAANPTDAETMRSAMTLNKGVPIEANQAVSPEGQVLARNHLQEIEDVKFKIAQQQAAASRYGSDATVKVQQLRGEALIDKAKLDLSATLEAGMDANASKEEINKLIQNTIIKVAGDNNATKTEIAAMQEEGKRLIAQLGVEKAMYVSDNILTGNENTNAASLTERALINEGAVDLEGVKGTNTLAQGEQSGANAVTLQGAKGKDALALGKLSGANALGLDQQRFKNRVKNQGILQGYNLDAQKLVNQGIVEAAIAKIKPKKQLTFKDTNDVKNAVLDVLGIPDSVDDDPNGLQAQAIKLAAAIFSQGNISGPEAAAKAVKQLEIEVNPPKFGIGGFDLNKRQIPKPPVKQTNNPPVSPISIKKLN